MMNLKHEKDLEREWYPGHPGEWSEELYYHRCIKQAEGMCCNCQGECEPCEMVEGDRFFHKIIAFCKLCFEKNVEKNSIIILYDKNILFETRCL